MRKKNPSFKEEGCLFGEEVFIFGRESWFLRVKVAFWGRKAGCLKKEVSFRRESCFSGKESCILRQKKDEFGGRRVAF